MEAKLQQQVPQQDYVNKPNLTGIPTQMKLDFEQRSGLSFDDVQVHYNSDKPAQLQAFAYTQGTQVYVGPGQERYLPHELGHVVQQKTSLITATRKINGTEVNDNTALEDQADKFAHITKRLKNQKNNLISNKGGIVQRARLNVSTRKSPNRTKTTINKNAAKILKTNQGTKKKSKVTFDKKWKKDRPFVLKQTTQKKQTFKATASKKTTTHTTAPPATGPIFVGNNRVPTFFSYKFADGNIQHQGPHTIAHTYWVLRLNDSSVSWESIFRDLILPNPIGTVLKILTDEDETTYSTKYATDYNQYYIKLMNKVECTGHSYDTSYFSTIDAMRQHYAINGATATVFYYKSKPITIQEVSDIGNTMLRLLEMHPYNTYGWKRTSMADITSFESKGKGESDIKKRPNDFNLIVDAHGFFKKAGKYADFLRLRLPWLNSYPAPQFEDHIKKRFIYAVCSDIDECIEKMKNGCEGKLPMRIDEKPIFIGLAGAISIDSLPINFYDVLNHFFGEEVAKKYSEFMLIRKNYNTYYEIQVHLNNYKNLESIIVSKNYYQQPQGTPFTQRNPRHSPLVNALQNILLGKSVDLHLT